MDLNQLNQAQYEAVTLDPARNGAIIAGAGTGKTRVLTFRIAALLEQEMDPQSIVAVTFTNKAAGEMRNRLGELVGKAQAIHVRLHTFHGLGLKLVQKYGSILGYTDPSKIRPIDTEDATALLRRLIKNRLTDTEQKVHKPSILMKQITDWKDAGKLPDTVKIDGNSELAQMQRIALSLYPLYEKEKLQSGVVDFADMIIMPVRIFDIRPEVTERFHRSLQQILVDEFQDTNPLQMRLLEQLSNRGESVPCFVVGDDDQSIYGFRGATSGIFRYYLERFPDPALIRLEQNYRCNPLILEAANTVIANNQERIGKTLFTDNQVADFLTVLSSQDDKEEANRIANLARQQIEAGIPPDEIAILFRKNAHTRPFEESLFRAGVPYRILGGTPFFARKEIKDALAYLRLVFSTEDNEAFVRAVTVPPKGIGGKRLDTLRTAAQRTGQSLFSLAMGGPDTKQRLFCRQILEFQEVYRSEGLKRLVQTVVEQSKLAEYYESKEKEKGEERAENLRELISAAFDFHHRFHMGETATAEMSPLPGDELSEFLTEAVLDADGATKTERQPAIQLLTIHKSKGLEFMSVFVPVIEQGEFPTQQAEKADDIEEERRLFYVAITRAKRFLTLSHAYYRRRSFQSSVPDFAQPSRFLAEIPPHLFVHPLQSVTQPAALPQPRKGPVQIPAFSRPKSIAGDLF